MLMRAVALVPAVLLAHASAQNVIVVDAAGGAGSDHTNLAAAIGAAGAGDILLLRSGDYPCTQFALPNFSGFVIDKSLALHADTNALAVLTSEFQVKQLAASSWVTLRGFAIRAKPAPFSDNYDLSMWSCAGAVRIEDVDVGPNPSPVQVRGVTVLSCSNTAFSYVNIDAGPAPPPGFVAGNSALDWVGSNGTIHASTIRSYPKSSAPGASSGNPGGVGMRQFDGALFLSGSMVHGGDGGNSGLSSGVCVDGADGGNAMQLEGTLPVLTSQASSFLPGVGGNAIPPCSQGDPGVAVKQLVGTHINHAGFPRLLHTTSPVREGQDVIVNFYGQSGDLVFLMFSGTGSSLSVPGVIGPLLLAAPNVKFIGTLFAGGPQPALAATTKFYPTQDLGAGIEGVQIRMQAAFVHPTYGTILSNESDLLLLDVGF